MSANGASHDWPSRPWLGIDGALGPFSAALVEADGTIVRVAQGAGNDALERGLTLVSDVLAGMPLSRLGGIAVGLGPGSFTGVRIALSYAKSLAFATGLQLAGVSSYDAVLPSATSLPEPAFAFVPSRAGFGCVRAAVSGAFLCGSYLELAGFIAEEAAGQTLSLAGPGAEGLISALGERGMTVFAHPSAESPPAVAVARRAMSAGAPLTSPHALRADYGERHYAERAELREGT